MGTEVYSKNENSLKVASSYWCNARQGPEGFCGGLPTNPWAKICRRDTDFEIIPILVCGLGGVFIQFEPLYFQNMAKAHPVCALVKEIYGGAFKRNRFTAMLPHFGFLDHECGSGDTAEPIEWKPKTGILKEI